MQKGKAPRGFGKNSKINYTVALEADEVNGHRDGPVAVPVQGLDVVKQVCKKLVTPFEHTQGHDVVSTHFLHDLSGQSLRPGITWDGGWGERQKEGMASLVFCYSQQKLSFLFCVRQQAKLSKANQSVIT